MSSLLLTPTVEIKKEDDGNEEAILPVVATASSNTANTLLMCRTKMEAAVEDGEDTDNGTGVGSDRIRHGTVHRTVKKEETEDEDDPQHHTLTNSTTTSSPSSVSAAMLPPDQIRSSSLDSNSSSSRHDGTDDVDTSTDWEAGHWCWLWDNEGDHYNDEKDEQQGNEAEKEEDPEETTSRRTLPVRAKSFATATTMAMAVVPHPRMSTIIHNTHNNNNTFTQNNNNDEDTTIMIEEAETGRAHTNDNIWMESSIHDDDWTTGNWCWDVARPKLTHRGNNTVRSAPAITTTVAVSTYTTTNKRKSGQSPDKKHAKKPRNILQHRGQHTHTNLDNDDNTNGQQIARDGHTDNDNGDDEYHDDDDDDDDNGEIEWNCDNGDSMVTETTDTNINKPEEIIRNTYDLRWTEMYGRLLTYKETYQSISVPAIFDYNPRLGRWVSKQKLLYTNNKLSKDRINRLDSIGFAWKTGVSWTDMYARLVAYKEQYDSTCVPAIYKADLRLGRWVHTQRRRKNTNTSLLVTDRINRLNKIGFVWNAIDAQWVEMFDRLVAYEKQYKTTCVPLRYKVDPKLGTWVQNQRQYYKKNKNNCRFTTDRINRLNKIGFVWNAIDAHWVEMFGRLVAYKKKYNSTCVQLRYKVDPQLGRWVAKQRRNYINSKKGIVNINRINRLNSIGFVWRINI